MAVNDSMVAGLLVVGVFCGGLLLIGGLVELAGYLYRVWHRDTRALSERVSIAHVHCYRKGCHRSRPWTDMDWHPDYGYCCPADDCESFDLTTDLGSVA